MKLGTALGMQPDERKWRESPSIADNNTFVGVEVELEGLPYWSPEYTELLRGLWHLEKDGSLRNNGMEFIMCSGNKEPVRAGDIIRALNGFENAINAYSKDRSPPICSERTSVHIHIDVRDLSVGELRKFILLYSIFEDTFFNWLDPARKYNNYCRSIGNNSDILERLGMIASMDEEQDHIVAHLIGGNKYDAMNYLSIKQRGSAEFRLMGGTFDTKVILKWINMLLALKVSSRDKSIVIDSFPEDMSMRGMDNLIDVVFGSWGSDLVEHASPASILEGVRQAQDILLVTAKNNLEHQFQKQNSKESFHLKSFAKNITQE